MKDLPLTGGCNCGAVRFEVTEPLIVASYCHCTRCQRRSGTAASASAHPKPGTFRIVAGEDRLRVWTPDGGGEKWFCGDCGSPIFGRNPAHADPIRHPDGRLRRRSGNPAERPPVRGLRCALGADPGRRAAPLPREPPRAGLTRTHRTHLDPQRQAPRPHATLSLVSGSLRRPLNILIS